MNVYSELWALLRPEKSLDGGGALFGTLAGISPLTVRVGGHEPARGGCGADACAPAVRGGLFAAVFCGVGEERR